MTSCHVYLVCCLLNLLCWVGIELKANGEIYNHKKIRKQFASKHTFSTGSDCEVIIPLVRPKSPPAERNQGDEND